MPQRRFARYGPTDGFPPGGACISSFVIVRKRDSYLMGKIIDPGLWFDNFNLNKSKPAGWADKWRLPATYLKLGEHPEDAAKRVMEEQLGLKNYELFLAQVQSHTGESAAYKGEIHWDLCYVYIGLYPMVRDELSPTRFFSELSFNKIDEVNPEEMGSGHGAVLKSLKEAKGTIYACQCNLGRASADPQ
ncbi:MAG: NUDIX domain-containing protein [Nitrososphaerales archaeon]